MKIARSCNGSVLTFVTVSIASTFTATILRRIFDYVDVIFMERIRRRLGFYFSQTQWHKKKTTSQLGFKFASNPHWWHNQFTIIHQNWSINPARARSIEPGVFKLKINQNEYEFAYHLPNFQLFFRRKGAENWKGFFGYTENGPPQRKVRNTI